MPWCLPCPGWPFITFDYIFISLHICIIILAIGHIGTRWGSLEACFIHDFVGIQCVPQHYKICKWDLADSFFLFLFFWPRQKVPETWQYLQCWEDRNVCNEKKRKKKRKGRQDEGRVVSARVELSVNGLWATCSCFTSAAAPFEPEPPRSCQLVQPGFTTHSAGDAEKIAVL